MEKLVGHRGDHDACHAKSSFPSRLTAPTLGTTGNSFYPNLFSSNIHGINLSVLNQVAASMNWLLDFSLVKGLNLLPVIALQTGISKYCIETGISVLEL